MLFPGVTRWAGPFVPSPLFRHASLYLDFAAGVYVDAPNGVLERRREFGDLFDNSRAGTVYQTTSTGGIEAVAAETTRTAHWRGGKPHALFEPGRTNLCPNSSPGTGWPATGATMTESAATSPLGATDASSVNITAGSGFIYDFCAVTAGEVYTFSWFAKAGTATAWVNALFDESNSAFISRTTYTLTDGIAYGDYYRHSVTFTAPSGCTGVRIYPLRGSDAGGAVSGATGTTFIWGVMLEQGAFATSPILTSGSAVARAADSASAALSVSPVGQSGGSIRAIGRADYTAGGSGLPRIFQVDDGTENNTVRFFVSENDGRLRVEVVAGGVLQCSESLIYSSGAEFDALLVFAEDNVFISLDGANSTPDTTASFPTDLLTTWRWGQNAAGASNGAAVLINLTASFPHQFSTTEADAITG